MNKLVRILMSKSIKRVLNPKGQYGMRLSRKILIMIGLYKRKV